MSITNYFIKHPVVALVLNCMILLVGVLCLESLSIREYPPVEFSKVIVSVIYPNASAELMESSVTNVLEDELSGIEGMDYITSQSADNRCTVTINFKAGTSMDRALLAAREAVSKARGLLPKDIEEPIVQRQVNTDGPPFIGIMLESADRDNAALMHYANLNLKNTFRSLDGVASVLIWGSPYTYRIALDAKKMFAFGVNADEVSAAIARSNLSLPIGKFQKAVPMTLVAELKNVEDFENLIIREGTYNQKPIYLKSLADITLTSDNENVRVRVNHKPGLAIAINRASDANPIDVSERVHAEIKKIEKQLPDDLHLEVIIDQAEFVRASLHNIYSSILEAIILVLAVVFLFLRNFRSAIIPLVTIPISLVGSFLFLKIFGFSVNIMTLLAMVLAVGLVVDDAIVVLENITRHIEEGMKPLEASLRGAKEIGFAIVAMTLTLTSVYAPIAFVSGVVGRLFIEFAVALAGSVLISGIVALTLSPLMCSMMLRAHSKQLFPSIDRFLDNLSGNYEKNLALFMNKRAWAIACAVFSIVAMFMLIKILPSEMAPKEDRNLIGAFIPHIPGEDMDGYEQKIIDVESKVANIPEAQNCLTCIGQWGGYVILPLKPKVERKRWAYEIVGHLFPIALSFPSMDVWPWSWDSGLPGSDDATEGSTLSIAISTTDSYRTLFDQVEKVRMFIDERKIFDSVRQDLKLDNPGYSIELNTNLMAEIGILEPQVAKTIEVFFSGDTSQTFDMDGQSYKIRLEGNRSYWTLYDLYLNNRARDRISVGAIAKLVSTAQPLKLDHYNQMRSSTITIDLRKGEKIETAMPKLLEVLDEVLPSHYRKNWTGAAKAYLESSSTMLGLFVLAVVFIFAILAIQFEDFIDPLIILITVPLGCFGALLTVWLIGQSFNLYTQVGLITLIGLITKHGILIVEFSNQLVSEGMPLKTAIQKACALRFRPILMTTGAMMFGAIPLLVSQDAGCEARQVIGAVLVGGLGFGTLFTLFVLPTVCYAIKKMRVVSRNS
jgi:multidrug efflux pump